MHKYSSFRRLEHKGCRFSPSAFKKWSLSGFNVRAFKLTILHYDPVRALRKLSGSQSINPLCFKSFHLLSSISYRWDVPVKAQPLSEKDFRSRLHFHQLALSASFFLLGCKNSHRGTLGEWVYKCSNIKWSCGWRSRVSFRHLNICELRERTLQLELCHFFIPSLCFFISEASNLSFKSAGVCGPVWR